MSNALCVLCVPLYSLLQVYIMYLERGVVGFHVLGILMPTCALQYAHVKNKPVTFIVTFVMG